jgi:hypothetical protein
MENRLGRLLCDIEASRDHVLDPVACTHKDVAHEAKRAAGASLLDTLNEALPDFPADVNNIIAQFAGRDPFLHADLNAIVRQCQTPEEMCEVLIKYTFALGDARCTRRVVFGSGLSEGIAAHFAFPARMRAFWDWVDWKCAQRFTTLTDRYPLISTIWRSRKHAIVSSGRHPQELEEVYKRSIDDSPSLRAIHAIQIELDDHKAVLDIAGYWWQRLLGVLARPPCPLEVVLATLAEAYHVALLDHWERAGASSQEFVLGGGEMSRLFEGGSTQSEMPKSLHDRLCAFTGSPVPRCATSGDLYRFFKRIRKECMGKPSYYTFLY